MPFYTVKLYANAAYLGDMCMSAVDRPSAIRIANEWAALKGWTPDCWKVYRNADTRNGTWYEREKGRFRAVLTI